MSPLVCLLQSCGSWSTDSWKWGQAPWKDKEVLLMGKDNPICLPLIKKPQQQPRVDQSSPFHLHFLSSTHCSHCHSAEVYFIPHFAVTATVLRCISSHTLQSLLQCWGVFHPTLCSHCYSAEVYFIPHFAVTATVLRCISSHTLQSLPQCWGVFPALPLVGFVGLEGGLQICPEAKL